jgi:hypothetical protein
MQRLRLSWSTRYTALKTLHDTLQYTVAEVDTILRHADCMSEAEIDLLRNGPSERHTQKQMQRRSPALLAAPRGGLQVRHGQRGRAMWVLALAKPRSGLAFQLGCKLTIIYARTPRSGASL